MGTFSALQTDLAAELRDPSNLTFDTTTIARFINEGVIEVGRLAPARLQVDITPTANTLVYTVSTGEPEIEVKKVELWDGSTTPHTFVMRVPPISGEYVDQSSVGWELWNGQLEIPNGLEQIIDPTKHLIRVWGYGPYAIVSGSTELPMSTELEYAVRTYAKLKALESMLQQRNLFTQWQSTSQNTEVTSASLIQQISQARVAWLQQATKITILREAH